MDIKKLIIIGLLPITLSGCVAAAVLAGATVGGSVIYDNRNVKTQMRDRQITSIAEYRIDNDEKLHDNSNISVATYNGVVLIVGQAQTQELKEYSTQLLASIKGVRKVFNEVTIAGSDSILQETSDSWITSKAKTEMLARKNLQSSEIKVVTEDGVVYLMGTVSHAQAEIAADTVRRIGGVRKVVEVFEYT